MERRRFIHLTSLTMAGTLLKAQGPEEAAARAVDRFSAEFPQCDPHVVGLRRRQVIALDGNWHFKEDPNEIGEQQRSFSSRFR